MQTLTRKSLNMATKPGKDPLVKTLAFRVSESAYRVISHAMDSERRIESDVCRSLLERGIAAYERDGKLFEPEVTKYKSVPQVRTAPERKSGTR